jgi:hypothetical protein
MKFAAITFFAMLIAVVGILSFEEPTFSAEATSAPSPIFNLYFPATSDTITSAENDTLLFGTKLDGKYSYNYYLKFTNLSGTTAANVILQETNVFDTDDAAALWYPVDTAAVSGAGVYRLFGELVYGRHQRLIIDGSGVQSSTYAINGTYKRD